mmetsp:Transcript_5462/g.8864  ORF Transcript_5462/g.8864 Transcript_5462/m.8864 type:complete len:342 (+) Transcript_5462:433-1458(+)
MGFCGAVYPTDLHPTAGHPRSTPPKHGQRSFAQRAVLPFFQRRRPLQEDEPRCGSSRLQLGKNSQIQLPDIPSCSCGLSCEGNQVFAQRPAMVNLEAHLLRVENSNLWEMLSHRWVNTLPLAKFGESATIHSTIQPWLRSHSWQWRWRRCSHFSPVVPLKHEGSHVFALSHDRTSKPLGIWVEGALPVQCGTCQRGPWPASLACMPVLQLHLYLMRLLLEEELDGFPRTHLERNVGIAVLSFGIYVSEVQAFRAQAAPQDISFPKDSMERRLRLRRSRRALRLPGAELLNNSSKGHFHLLAVTVRGQKEVHEPLLGLWYQQRVALWLQSGNHGLLDVDVLH